VTVTVTATVTVHVTGSGTGTVSHQRCANGHRAEWALVACFCLFCGFETLVPRGVGERDGGEEEEGEGEGWWRRTAKRCWEEGSCMHLLAKDRAEEEEPRRQLARSCNQPDSHT